VRRKEGVEFCIPVSGLLVQAVCCRWVSWRVSEEVEIENVEIRRAFVYAKALAVSEQSRSLLSVYHHYHRLQDYQSY
jgi:hypothetical protein